MNKVLVYGGIGLTCLGVIEVILFMFAYLTKELDKIGEPKITEIIIIWCVGTAILFIMGSKFVDKGLTTLSQGSKEE